MYLNKKKKKTMNKLNNQKKYSFLQLTLNKCLLQIHIINIIL
jgi:hypothetical protein